MSKKRKKGRNRSPLGVAAGLFLVIFIALVCAWLPMLSTIVGQAQAEMRWEGLIPLAGYCVGFLMFLLCLRVTGWQGDAGLLGAIMLLSGVGVVIQYRMGGYAQGLARPQTLLPLPLGLVVMLAGVTMTGKGRGAWLVKTGWLAYLMAIGVFAVMLAMGQRFRGGVYMPGFVNPSEVAKPLLVVFLAAFLCQRKEEFSESQMGIPVPSLDALLILLFCWVLPLLLILALKDLGLMVIMNAVLVIMVFAVSRKVGYLGAGFMAVLAGGWGMRALSGNARNRFDVWLDPFVDATGKGWQNLQALCAMYSGGLWGAGLGSGAPQSIPIVSSDFIYAALAEEIGLLGCGLLLVVYLLLFSRAFRVAGSVRTPFEQLLCVGLTSLLAVQTLVNVAGVTKALPMTGVTLPFVSHGGSSLIVSMLIAGILVGLSDTTKVKRSRSR